MFKKYLNYILPVIGGVIMSVVIGMLSKDTPSFATTLTALFTTLILSLSIQLADINQKIEDTNNKLETIINLKHWRH